VRFVNSKGAGSYNNIRIYELWKTGIRDVEIKNNAFLPI
jgi:hypothetical protein